MPERFSLDTDEVETLTTAGLAEVLGVEDDRARQLADQHDLVLGRDPAGRRIISVARARALAIARAARAASRLAERSRERGRAALAAQVAAAQQPSSEPKAQAVNQRLSAAAKIAQKRARRVAASDPAAATDDELATAALDTTD
jgi:hypothetical protein